MDNHATNFHPLTKKPCTAANILVRYLGEEGAQTPIAAAASLCNPFDLVPFHQLHCCCASLKCRFH